MSYQTFFSFTAGINKTIILPIGSIEHIRSTIEDTEEILGIEREQYLDNPIHWAYNDYKDIKDEILCKTAEAHNDAVRDFYRLLSKFSDNPAEDGEELTSQIFSELLPGLRTVSVPSHRWTGDYYTERMKVLYEVMRGRESEGISFDTRKLTERQAANVILLFSEFLDGDDRRLDVPKGHDYLASSYDGGYDWCEKCGAVTWEDAQECNKKKCPLRE